MSISSKELQRLGFAGSHKPQQSSSSAITIQGENLGGALVSADPSSYRERMQSYDTSEALEADLEKLTKSTEALGLAALYRFVELNAELDAPLSENALALRYAVVFGRSDRTLRRWLKAAPEDIQDLIPKDGRKDRQRSDTRPNSEPTTDTEPVTTEPVAMPVPILLDQTTGPDGSVEDNLVPPDGYSLPLAKLAGYLSNLTPPESIGEEETGFTKMVKDLQAAGRVLAARVARGEQGNLTCNIRSMLKIASEEFTKLHALVKEVEATK